VLRYVARSCTASGRRARPDLGPGVKVAGMACNTGCPKCGVISTSDFVSGVCRTCYMSDYNQRRFVSPVAVIHDIYGQRLCVECREPGTYARGLCTKCYKRDRQRRHRVICTCAGCGVSFQSSRSDVLYCSRSCRLRARHAAQPAKQDALAPSRQSRRPGTARSRS
jgi:hypothetical protein